MAADNKLELVVEIDASRANASIKSVNAGLSGIESTAAQTARGASTSIDGMTAAMVKGATAGNLLADGIKQAIQFAKEWTIDAAKMAAHNARLEASTKALAAAHGVSAAALKEAVEAVQQVGFLDEDALHAVSRLIIADLELSKAPGLAKVAKDAAAIENISAPEALEKLLRAIESGASRGLRTMGIFVDLNKEVQRQELLTGKTLDENQVRQLRYNAVMREAAKIQGAHAAASGEAELQMQALAREATELKEAVGAEFQGYLKSVISHLRDLVGFLRDNTDWLAKFAEAAIFAAGAIATYGIVTKIGATASAVQGLATALTAHPIALLLTGVATGGAIIWKTWQDTKADLNRQYEDMRRKGLQQDLFSGKLKPADVKQMGYSDDQVREILTGKRLPPGESWDEFSGLPKLNLKISGKKELTNDEIRRIAEVRKRQAEAMKAADELYMRSLEERKNAEREVARQQIDDSMKVIEATQSEATAAKEALNVLLLSQQEYAAGIARIRQEEKKEIEARSTYVDEKSGAIQRFTLRPEVLARIHQATAERIAAFELKFNEEQSRRVEQMWKALAARRERFFEQYVLEPMRQDLEIWQQAFDLDERRKDQQLVIEKAAVDQRKDLALAQLEAVDAVTLRDKIGLEAAKTQIEVEAIRQRTEIELREIDRRTEHDIREAERAAYAKGIFDEQRISQITGRIRELGAQEKAALGQAATNEVEVAQLKGAAATRRLVVDHYRSIFDSLKQQAGGVFDALVTKSQSVWSAIGNSLKTAILSALKEVVTSRIAAALLQLFTGTRITFAQGGMGGGGMLGKLGGILGIGAVPVFGAGAPVGAGAVPGLGGSGIPGAPGGTVGFAGPVAGNAPSTGAGGTLGGWGAKAAGFLPGLKSFFGIGGSVQLGPGMATTWEAATLLQKISAVAKSNAALMGGFLLGMEGLRRGGVSGLAMTTAGGAMIGYRFGGPLGAAIGAGVGAIAGIVRLFVKGAEEKARSKVKAIYGVDISDKGVLRQIVDIAKQAYGGNLDVAIRSQQVQDLVELYAMSTGQNSPLRATPRALNLVQQSGGLFQAGSLENGRVVGYASSFVPLGGASFDRLAPSGYQTGGPVYVNINLDGDATTRVMRGEAVQAVQENPRVVQQAAATAQRGNYGRRETAANLTQPGTVFS
jgi:hypothetical protein